MMAAGTMKQKSLVLMVFPKKGNFYNVLAVVIIITTNHRASYLPAANTFSENCEELH